MERDIREMAVIREPSMIMTLLSYMAAITAQEHNSANTANKTTLHRQTVNRYVALLEAVFLIHRLPVWSRNLTARVVKHSKVHLTDTGLAASLLGVSPQSLAAPVAPARGPLVETFIVNELTKQATWSDTPRSSAPLAGQWRSRGRHRSGERRRSCRRHRVQVHRHRHTPGLPRPGHAS